MMTVHFYFHDTAQHQPSPTPNYTSGPERTFGKCKPQISRTLWSACKKTIAWSKEEEKQAGVRCLKSAAGCGVWWRRRRRRWRIIGSRTWDGRLAKTLSAHLCGPGLDKGRSLDPDAGKASGAPVPCRFYSRNKCVFFFYEFVEPEYSNLSANRLSFVKWVVLERLVARDRCVRWSLSQREVARIYKKITSLLTWGVKL